MSSIDDLMDSIRKDFKVSYFYKFPLVRGNMYYQVYFSDKIYNDPKQLRLWGDDEWNSMKKDNYQK